MRRQAGRQATCLEGRQQGTAAAPCPLPMDTPPLTPPPLLCQMAPKCPSDYSGAAGASTASADAAAYAGAGSGASSGSYSP